MLRRASSVFSVAVVVSLASACSAAYVREPAREIQAQGQCRDRNPQPVELARRPGWRSAADWPDALTSISSKPGCAARTGCPYIPLALPPCMPSTGIDDDWWKTSESGRRVQFRGQLEAIPGETTQAGCFPLNPCCNLQRPQLVIRTDHGRVLPREASRLKAFTCFGDVSGFCCPIAPIGQSVIVRGTIVRGNGVFDYVVERPAICLDSPVDPGGRR